jgi:adenylyltransferase/sulfurtransferase
MMNRYNRHIKLEEVGVEGQEKLTQAKVLVVGAGGLGCPVLQYLTAAGIGKIGIIDPDFVTESNLQRQILYTTKDLGELKVEVAQKRLTALNADVDIETYPEFIGANNVVDLVTSYDIVVDGTDQIHTRYLLDDACRILGKPLVYGAIHKFQGQVSTFHYQNGPGYRDLFPTPPNPESVPSCNEVGVLGVLPGMIGVMQANEVLKIILGYGQLLSGKFWMLDAKTNEANTIEFEKMMEHIDAPQTLEELERTDYIAYCNPVFSSNTEGHKEPQRTTEKWS